MITQDIKLVSTSGSGAERWLILFNKEEGIVPAQN